MQQQLRDLQARLGVVFRDEANLRLALVHRSFLHERPAEASESNERLEFLGDSLLGMVIADELFRRFPGKTEGWLTEARSRLVRTETLAAIAKVLGLGEALLLGRGEEQSGGRERQRNLARTYEAVVGAVYVDQGYRKARSFLLRSFAPQLKSMDGGSVNYKSLLQEAVQGQGQPLPEYRVVEEARPNGARLFQVEVLLHGVVSGRGEGGTKRLAEQEAARQAYEAL